MSQREHNLRMDYIEFPATDIAATKRFYNDVFGWEFKDWGPDYISFNDGRMNGGFTTGSQPAGADGAKTRGALVVLYATSLDDALPQGERSGRQDCPRDLRLPRRQALSLRRSQRQRACRVE